MVAIGDTTMAAAEHALRGLATRADVRGNNLANLHTPGFRADSVDFETSLRAAVESRSDLRQAGAPTIRTAPNLPNPWRNTVDLESEMVGMIKDNLARDAMVNAFNYKVGVLRAAISGR